MGCIYQQMRIICFLGVALLREASIFERTIVTGTINHIIMNKAELIESVATGAGLSKANSKRALDAFVSATTAALKRNERVALVGFGSFSVSERAARTGRNPQTGASIRIAAKKVVRFKAGSDLSEAVN